MLLRFKGLRNAVCADSPVFYMQPHWSRPGFGAYTCASALREIWELCSEQGPPKPLCLGAPSPALLRPASRDVCGRFWKISVSTRLPFAHLKAYRN